jgi:hypothetical protein
VIAVAIPEPVAGSAPFCAISIHASTALVDAVLVTSFISRRVTAPPTVLKAYLSGTLLTVPHGLTFAVAVDDVSCSPAAHRRTIGCFPPSGDKGVGRTFVLAVSDLTAEGRPSIKAAAYTIISIGVLVVTTVRAVRSFTIELTAARLVSRAGYRCVGSSRS